METAQEHPETFVLADEYTLFGDHKCHEKVGHEWSDKVKKLLCSTRQRVHIISGLRMKK